MSTPAALIDTEAVNAATVDDLLAVAHTLLRHAYHHTNTHPEPLEQDHLFDLVTTTQHLQNTAWAIQTRHLTRLIHTDQLGANPDTSDDAQWLPLELGARLGWSDQQTNNRLTLAEHTTEHLPHLLDQAGAGGLDAGKVTAIAHTTHGAPAHVTQHIQERILAGDPEGSTATKLRCKARRLLTRLDPVSADTTAAKRRRDAIGVFTHPHHEPGLSEITAVLPTLDAAKLMTAIDDLAHDLHHVTATNKTLAECRIDAFTDLMLTNVSIDTQLTLLIPLAEPVTTGSASTTASATEPTAVPELIGAGSAAVTGVGSAATDAGAVGMKAPRLPPESPLPRRSQPPPGWSTTQWYDHLCDEEDRLDSYLEDLIDYERLLWPDGWPPPDPATTPPPPTPFVTPASTDPPSPGQPVPPTPPTAPAFDDVLIPNMGVIPAGTIEVLATMLGVKLSRALTHPGTGVIAETAIHGYRPGAGLLRFVRTRDQHCRFPGCTRPAIRCDADHVTRYPDGPTAAHNLQCLCRHHHRAKHEGGWAVTMTPDGTCTWTSPSGRTYITRPDD